MSVTNEQPPLTSPLNCKTYEAQYSDMIQNDYENLISRDAVVQRGAISSLVELNITFFSKIEALEIEVQYHRNSAPPSTDWQELRVK